MLKRGLVLLGFAILSAGAPLTAMAMPLARPAATATPMIETVAMGCGPGWTLNRWGQCVPFRRFAPVYVAPRPRFWGPGYYHGPRRFYGGYRRHW